MTSGGLPDDLPAIPLLLREARGSYASAIRVAIASVGLPEIPRMDHSLSASSTMAKFRSHNWAASERSRLRNTRQSSVFANPAI